MPHVGVIDGGGTEPLDTNTLCCISWLTQRFLGDDRSPEPDDQRSQRRRHVACRLRQLLLSLCCCQVIARAQSAFKARRNRKPGEECVVEKRYFSLSFLFLLHTLCVPNSWPCSCSLVISLSSSLVLLLVLFRCVSGPCLSFMCLLFPRSLSVEGGSFWLLVSQHNLSPRARWSWLQRASACWFQLKAVNPTSEILRSCTSLLTPSLAWQWYVNPPSGLFNSHVESTSKCLAERTETLSVHTWSDVTGARVSEGREFLGPVVPGSKMIVEPGVPRTLMLTWTASSLFCADC